ncbi:MAG TPA: hypothetical protein PKV94_07155 [Syntrophales bacterium]|nr:hypothetical protein [Syntrophales bacterium]HPN24765.1 hypothetical protein [Syntrophales bacterium]
MTDEPNVRWDWLKRMYIYTIIAAGGFGLGIIIMPERMKSIFGWPVQDPLILGICGSVFAAFGLLSILGLRSPLKFAPILLLQLTYKVVWFIGVVFPLLFAGQYPHYGLLHAVIFATFVFVDLIAIPFSYVFARQPKP